MKIPKKSEILRRIASLESRVDDVAYAADVSKNSNAVALTGDKILTRLFTHQKIVVSSKDFSLAPHLIMDGYWEKEISDIWRSLVEADSVVVDIGANYGYYGMLAGTMLDKTGRLIVIEANPNLSDFITINLELNGLTQRTIFESIALSNKKGKTSFFTPAEQWMNASTKKKKMKLSNIEDFKKHTVPTDTLDGVIEQNDIKKVDVIKIDVEGAEQLVYEGMQKTVDSNKNLALLLEYCPDFYNKPNEFLAQLLNDFDNVFVITEDGKLEQINSVNELKNHYTFDNWAMLMLVKGTRKLNLLEPYINEATK